MDAYIKAVEEIGFKKDKGQNDERHIRFHQKGVSLIIQDWSQYQYANFFTEKKAANGAAIQYDIHRVMKEEIAKYIRAIVRFWAKNGVKLGKTK